MATIRLWYSDNLVPKKKVYQVVSLGDISDWSTTLPYPASWAGFNASRATTNPPPIKWVGTPLELWTDPSGVNMPPSAFGLQVDEESVEHPSNHYGFNWSEYNAAIPGYRRCSLIGQGRERGFLVPYGYGNPLTVADPMYLAIATINGTKYLGVATRRVVGQDSPTVPFGSVSFYYDPNWSATLYELADVAGDDRNPFSPGGYSGPGGGGGTFGDESDDVGPDEMPDEEEIGATSLGLVTIFTPTKAQLKHLADVLWGKDFLSFMQNLVENIGDMFISLGMVPFVVSKGGTVEVTWFDWVATLHQQGTSINLDLAADQWVEMDMGSIDLSSDDRIFMTDSALDYSPYSKLGIYLPFIGFNELNIDECRGSVVNLTYRIDILSGSCVALITINGKTIYQFSGNCLTQIPLTGMDAQSMISNAVNVGIAASSVGTAGAVASAGDAFADSLAAVPLSANAPAEQGVANANRNELSHTQHMANVSNAKGGLASATANASMGMKPSFKMSGAVSAANSLLAVKQPYLFLTTPRQSMPDGYERYCGFPCNMVGTLGSFSGFTVVEDIRLNGLVATSVEVEEIYALLKSGVII